MRKLFFILMLVVPISGFAQEEGEDFDKLTPISELKGTEAAPWENFNIIFSADMEEASLGTYRLQEWIDAWNHPPWNTRLSETTIMEKDGSKVFRWVYPEGSVGSSRSGGQWETPIPGGFHEEIYMSYNVMFRPGFDYVLAGKLPGLKGGPLNWNAGVEKPHFDSGWLCGLLMKGSSNPRGYIAFYPYHQDQVGYYGDSKHWPNPYNEDDDLFYFKDGSYDEKWWNITIRIVMNTIKPDGSGGNNDGILEGFIDGVLHARYTNMRFRNVPSVGIDKMKVYSFFGGNTASFAARRDEWTLWDDFYLFTMAEGVDAPRGNTRSEFPRNLKLPWIKGAVPSPNAPFVDEVAPTVPQNVRITNEGPTSVTMEWDPSTDSIGVTGYRVFKNNVLDTAVTSTNYRMRNLVPETSYIVRVSAFDAASNESQKSDPVLANTSEADTEVPSAPENLKVDRFTSQSISISWDAASDNIGIDRYEISVNNEFNFGTRFTSFTIAPLEPATEYTIAVRAIDESNNLSVPSSSITVSTAAPDNQAPDAPSGLVATEVTESTARLQWNPSADNVSVEEYKIYVNFESNKSSTSNDYIIGSLEPGLPYEVYVTAVDESFNESPESNHITVTTKNQDVIQEKVEIAPTFPVIEIDTLLSYTFNPRSVTEIESIGFVGLKNYWMEISEKKTPETGRIVLAQKLQDTVVHTRRVTPGLQVLYNFSEGSGTRVYDQSNRNNPLDLQISYGGTDSDWLHGQGLRIAEKTSVSYNGSPGRLIDAISASNEITLEAWIKQEEKSQSGPARIITLGSNETNQWVVLGHEGNNSSFDYVSKLKSSDGVNSEISSDQEFQSLSLHHVAFTKNASGEIKLYVNGTPKSSSTTAENLDSFSDDIRFSIGNSLTENNPWNGILYLVAVYDRALSGEEVEKNFTAGTGQIRFTTSLDTLTSNVEYTLTPVLRTDQGKVFGNPRDFIYENVTKTDSLFSFRPNPSNGSIIIKVKDRDDGTQDALIRIADFSGNIHYAAKLDMREESVEKEFELQLPPTMQSGLYSVMVITNSSAAAEKMVLIRR